jgi:hypothetical protein
MARFAIGWEVRFWDASGRARTEAGEEVVDGEDARRAAIAVDRMIGARFAAPYELRTVHDGVRSSLGCYGASYPDGLPEAAALRARVRAGESPTTIVHELTSAGATTLAVMIAFEHAFDLSIDAFAAAVADLDAPIGEMQYRWDRPHRLHAAHARGESIVELLHANLERDGSIRLFVSLLEAFDLDFSDGKELIEVACRRDPRFDDMLATAIGRGPSRDWR